MFTRPPTLPSMYQLTFRLDQAAALGLGLATNCLALWESILALEASPDNPATEPFPVLVYGGSTATGTMTIQLLRLSGLDPITTCSPRNFDLVRRYGASAVFDYADPDAADKIRKHTGGQLRHVLDCFADPESIACSYASIARTGGRYVSLEHCAEELRTTRRHAVKTDFPIVLEIFGKAVQIMPAGGGCYERPASEAKHAAAVRWFRMFQRLLDEGKLTALPTQELHGGLEGNPRWVATVEVGARVGEEIDGYPLRECE